MAKGKAKIASTQKGVVNVKMAKVIVSQKTEKGFYAFKASMMPQDQVKNFLSKLDRI